ncbi:hypothetical protein C41B8_02167 [Salinisphaera hydrothermalis C41B8]|uniref:Porin domain-containing protein n=2 Tax=Salinisphaera TaxID=180541 RepID=A0A084IQB3_SALHC|nr:hypothetical protein C41B8_02167 [Salinisphaera hydrothermalis C41B8]
MTIKAHYAGLATGIVSMATVLGVAPAAHAFDFKLKGQVNRAVIASDNGKSTDAGLVDNHSSPSRFGFTGTQDVSPNLKVGFEYVMALATNTSSEYDVNGSQKGNAIENRQANVFFEGNYGKLTFGRTDGAANSTSKVDLSGLTDLGGGSVVDDYFGGLSFVDGAGNVGPSLKNGYSNFDALSRQNTVRYDTPSFAGATLSVSYDQGQAIEVAPRYKHKFANDVKVEAALDYVDSGNQDKTLNAAGNFANNSGPNRNSSFQEFGGSASMLLPSGLNFFAQYKRRNYSNTFYTDGASLDHAQSYSGGVGYIFGKNHVQAFFGQTDDLQSGNSQVRNYGVAYRYDLLKSVNMYASYHHLTGDNLVNRDGSSFKAKNMNVVFAGVRAKFF